MNKEYMLDILKKLCNTPSPSGFTHKAMKLVEEELLSFGLKANYTNKGSLYSFINGKNLKTKKAIAAHIDTLGAMVKDIKSNGNIVITPIGSYNGNSIECENCTIHTNENKEISGTIYCTKPSVHIHTESKTLERNFDNIEVVIDEKVKTREDITELGINIGDIISFDTRFKITSSGFIKSRHLDDKASVAIILTACKYISENQFIPDNTIQIYFTNYEEVGHGASSGLSTEIDELLCIDMGTPGIGQNTDEYSVSICAKDSGGPYDYMFRNKLVNLSKNNNIEYKVDIYPHYGSDALTALKSGMDIRTGLIGAGVYASHSYERTHVDSMMNTYKLLIEYIKE